MAGAAQGGIAYLKVDGVQYTLEGSFKVQPSNIERSGVAHQDLSVGYLEKPMVPSMEGELSDTGGLSLAQLLAITSATVTAELKTGKVYVLVNAWWAGPQTLDTVEGKLPFKFEGQSCQEII